MIMWGGAKPHPTLLCIFDIKCIFEIQVTLKNIATHWCHVVAGDAYVHDDDDDDDGHGGCDDYCHGDDDYYDDDHDEYADYDEHDHADYDDYDFDGGDDYGYGDD